MISSTYRRYIWLLRTLLQNKRMTFEEISQAWENSYLSDGRPLTKRTFHLHRKAIAEMFSVSIECNPSDGYRYFVLGERNLRQDKVLMGLINSLPMEDSPSQRILLRVYAPLAQTFRSCPFHASQLERLRNEGYSDFEYSLQLSQDLISQLLGFGDKVEVLEPASLRNEMKDIIKSMYNNYKK